MALVYFVFLPCGCRQHIHSCLHKFLARAEQFGKAGPHRDTLFDRNRNLARDFAHRRSASVVTGRNSMDSSRRHVSVADQRRMDFVLTKKLSPAAIRFSLPVIAGESKREEGP